MSVVSIPGKYVPIKNFRRYTANIEPKIDPDTNQVIVDAFRYEYKVILDKFNNVYILPEKDGKSLFTLADIVEAASGNTKKIEKINKIRQDLIDVSNADLLGQEWQDYFYNELINNDTKRTVREDMVRDAKRRDKGATLPEHVSSYEELSQNPRQVSALAATAKVPEKAPVTSTAPKAKTETPREQ